MQTGLRGRDLITLQEWTRDEIDTVIEVALDLKRRRALGSCTPAAGQGAGDAVLLLQHPDPGLLRGRHGATGRHAQFIEAETTQIAHGDTAKEIGEILGRYNDGIAIRQVDWGVGNGYIRDVAAASRVPCSTCSATCTTPSRSWPTC